MPPTTPVKESILESIRTRLVAINAVTSPSDYFQTVKRVVRGIIPPDDATGLTLMLNAFTDEPDNRMPQGGRATGGPPEGTQTRLLTVGVSAWLQHEVMTDTFMIQITADIERAVLSDRKHGTYAINSWWVKTTAQLQNATAPVGWLQLDFQVQYRTLFGKPSTQV